MREYKCGRNNSHNGVDLEEAPSESPHSVKIKCAKCGYFIKWGSRKEVAEIRTAQTAVINEAEIDSAVLCPLMSGMVIQPSTSEIRQARLRFEGNACVKERCAWWATIDNACAVTSIAFALLESKAGAK